jgi:hypothetical protein
MKLLLSVTCLFVVAYGFAQPERKDIIERKVRSITKTHWEKDSAQKVEIKNYYTQKGDDSLEYYWGKLSFRYMTILDEKGKVAMLERYNDRENLDEVHVYEYKEDGSYSIEVVAQGAGTILQTAFDGHHRCKEVIYSGTDTLQFQFNSIGKPEKVIHKNKKDGYKIVGSFIYGNDGLLQKAESLIEQRVTYFKHNENGLISELRSVQKNKSGEKETIFVFYSYEFWK